ncbi:hypothetical protein LIER_13654 [Lithospermum erythrorhizon]|uniref:RNase H type-1 domain-containing protein n=1 Tax=Lithospermum erythrorhizon TaxID=34254 RepID=A0AAV3PW65_LITER
MVGRIPAMGRKLAKLFHSCHIEHVPREMNEEGDRFSQVATVGNEKLPVATVDVLDFLLTGVLPRYPPVANKIQRQSLRYTLLDGVLYRRSFQGLLLRRVTREVGLMVLEEVHGACAEATSMRGS